MTRTLRHAHGTRQSDGRQEQHARSGFNKAAHRRPRSDRLLEVRAHVLRSCVEINMAPPQLWSISMSPWSVRAKWVLNYARVEYRNIEYNPFLVWVLRWRLWRWRITVPIMFTGETAPLLESFDIAAYGDEHRADGVESIMMDGVREWEDTAQVIMQAEKVRTAHALLYMAGLRLPCAGSVDAPFAARTCSCSCAPTICLAVVAILSTACAACQVQVRRCCGNPGSTGLQGRAMYTITVICVTSSKFEQSRGLSHVSAHHNMWLGRAGHAFSRSSQRNHRAWCRLRSCVGRAPWSASWFGCLLVQCRTSTLRRTMQTWCGASCKQFARHFSNANGLILWGRSRTQVRPGLQGCPYSDTAHYVSSRNLVQSSCCITAPLEILCLGSLWGECMSHDDLKTVRAAGALLPARLDAHGRCRHSGCGGAAPSEGSV